MFTTDLEANYNLDKLQTSINADGVEQKTNSLNNNINWWTLELAANEKITFNRPKINATLGLPISLYQYGFDDKCHKTPNNFNNLAFTPNININWKLWRFWTMIFISRYSIYYDSHSPLTKGYIITSYRQIVSNDNKLGLKKNMYSYLHLQFKNTIIGYYLAADLSFSINQNNYLIDSRLNSNGTVIKRFINHSNTSKHTNCSVQTSWLLSNIATTFGLKGQYSEIHSHYIFDGNIEKSNSKAFSLNPTVDVSYWKHLGLNYGFNYLIGKQQIGASTHKMIDKKHKLRIYIYPNKIHLISFDFECYISDYPNYESSTMFLANATYTFSPTKIPVQIKFMCRNLFDNKMFEQMYMTENLIVTNKYSIRPREIMLSIEIPMAAIKHLANKL